MYERSKYAIKLNNLRRLDKISLRVDLKMLTCKTIDVYVLHTFKITSVLVLLLKVIVKIKI